MRPKDAGLAAVLLAAAAFPLTAEQPGCQCTPNSLAYVAAVGMSLPIAFRGRAPIAVALVMTISSLGYALAVLFSPLVVVPVLVVLIAWLLADAERRERSRIAAQDSAEVAGRDARAAREEAERRTSLSREMQDLLSHSVSVQVVLAEGGAAAVRGRPQAALRAFDTIAGTGRRTLAELRALAAEEPDGRSAPGIGDLPELVQIMRAAGMALTMRGLEAVEANPAAGFAVYRIVQESLTNALNHAPGEPVDVEFAVADDGWRVTVSNPVLPQSRPGIGQGLPGMRERALRLGGKLTVEDDGDRWRVILDVPTDLGVKKLPGNSAMDDRANPPVTG